MEKTMKRYGVNHRFSTSYHSQTSGQVENTNKALKRILEKTVKDNPAIWSRKLDDALWAFRTAFKTPTGTTPYKLVYGKNCHLPFKIKHSAYRALKNCIPDLIVAGEKRMFQLHELDEFRHQAYEHSRLYKARSKVWHDRKLKMRKEFKHGNKKKIIMIKGKQSLPSFRKNEIQKQDENRGEHLIRRFAGRGNEPDPRDVKIASLKQRIQELEFPQLQQDSPAEETETESNVWDDGSEDVNPFGGGNPLLTKETESEPIIWDIGDEEEEYPFVNEYPSFKKEPIMFVEDESCPVYDTDNEEEESMPVYDTDIKDVIEEEEGFVGKGGFGGEEDNIEDVVVVANDLCSSMIQTILSVDFEEDINTKSHELMSFGKSIIIKVSQSSFKFLICKKYQEWYLKAPPMVDKLGFKTIKVRGRVVIKKENLMQGIQIWMLRVQGTSEANSRTSFSQVGEDDAD
ncbi:reverse transcriptase domain-containing protein [Tanacetum coccineum]